MALFPQGPGRPDGCTPEYMQKTPASQEALIRETDFAFKQSFAFCPYGPEAVYRYVNFLLQQNRLEDALIVAQTCQKLDPFNGSIVDLVNQIKSFKQGDTQRAQSLNKLQQMEAMAQTNPGNLPNVLTLASAYMQMQNPGRATELFDLALKSPNLSVGDASQIAQIFDQMGNFPKLEAALQKLVALQPEVPEPRYDLARLEATLGQTDPALKDLQIALDQSRARLKSNPKARDLLVEARKDENLKPLRNLPAFQKLVPPP